MSAPAVSTRPRQGSRRRVVAVLAGAGLVATAAPAAAAPRDDDEQAALVLLGEAAEASRALTYTGTQYVATWGTTTTSALVDVHHEPGRGARVSQAGERRPPVVVPPTALADELLAALSDTYQLRVSGQGHCTGRAADVVEARRPGGTGSAAVAGRFWVDRDTGLLLRREVFDAEGRRLRSSAFLELVVQPTAPAGPALLPASARTVDDDVAAGEPVPPAELRRLRADGVVAPAELPGSFALVAARQREHDGAQVLHLAYSDGLSTTSLFSQPGEPGSTPPEGFRAATVAGQPVWSAAGAPQRLVWAGGGRVWTLVSDAPRDAVDSAVAALPHEAMPTQDRGWRARVARGASRLGSALNPFA